MLSLFLGVLAVVTVQAGAEITKRALLADVELTQGRDGTVQVYLPAHPQTVSVVLDTLRDVPDAVAEVEVQVIVGEPGVTPVNPGGMPLNQAGGGAYYCDNRGACFSGPDPSKEVKPAGAAVELRLVGLIGDVRQFRPFPTDAGRWVDFAGPPALAPWIVLNREAAKGLTQHRLPAEMHLDGVPVNPTPRIAGVVHDGGSAPTAYVRADEILNWVSAGSNPPSVQVLLGPGARGIEKILRARLVGAGVPMDEAFSRTIDWKEQYSDNLALLQMIFLGMAGLVLLIGVAGILNVGLATIGERVEEFALRRAVGTPRLLLAGIVLSETLIIGLLTALAAIGTGVAGLNVLGQYLSDAQPFLSDVTFPWQAGVAGVIAGLAAGILGGLIPALRAARIPIATVMRA
ncbi:MAG: ABC transporter permease [Labedaea sp.]